MTDFKQGEMVKLNDKGKAQLGLALHDRVWTVTRRSVKNPGCYTLLIYPSGLRRELLVGEYLMAVRNVVCVDVDDTERMDNLIKMGAEVLESNSDKFAYFRNKTEGGIE